MNECSYECEETGVEMRTDTLVRPEVAKVRIFDNLSRQQLDERSGTMSYEQMNVPLSDAASFLVRQRNLRARQTSCRVPLRAA